MISHRSRSCIRRGTAILASVVALVAFKPAVQAANPTIGTVSYIEGKVLVGRAKAQSLNRARRGTKLRVGDTVKTMAGSKFEATLRDGSMLRLGEDSQILLKSLSFDRREPRKQKKVRAKLFFGRVWASVTSLFGPNSSFEVETKTAVAGVRGTKFTASATPEGDTTVRVYSGKVLVSNEPAYKVKGATKENRVQVPGPQEIGREAWEKLVAEAMQLVRVAADGEMGAPQGFSLGASAEDAEWEKWNAERDQKAGFED